MRPKIVIAVLLAGVVGVAIIFFLKPAANHPQPAVTPAAQPAATLPKPTAAAVPQLPPNTNATVVVTPSQPKKPVPSSTDEAVDEEAAKIQEQVDRLVDLSSNDDDASLQAILKELTNPNKVIRHEAIEATIQFGGHTAVPVLQDLAARTADPDEKKELLEAAEFLALPTLSEARAQNSNAQITQPPVPSPAPDQP
ncbi:MAG: HEAT repeat domain-containing protein [Verrucomicrobiales bacterium]|nr:HEAT repeat domain-containing protein [Verrucomicrobiales bacterium]